MTSLQTPMGQCVPESTQAMVPTTAIQSLENMRDRVRSHNDTIHAIIKTAEGLTTALHGESSSPPPSQVADAGGKEVGALSHVQFVLTDQEQLLGRLSALLTRI